ncbi:MAG: ATP-binding protein [Lachnospiraceae bacterium]
MLRMEIACILILMFIASIYFTASREKNAIHKIYSAILIILSIHLVFDAITVVTVARLDTFPRFWNDTFHRFFLATMLLTIYLFYRYICELIKIETGKEHQSKTLLSISRIFDFYLVVAEILLFVTPVTYAVTPKGNYETGWGAVILYTSIALFLVHMILNVACHWGEIHPKKRTAILGAFSIEIIVTVLTLMDTSLLLAGMGLTLIAVSFFLILENPDIKLLELAREEKQKADEANAKKSQFLSVVSHEIRTPMNAIVGMTDILLRSAKDETEISYLKNIKTSGDALLLIVNELLDQSKIEAGRMEIIEDVYEWKPIAENILTIAENRIEAKPITVGIEVDERIPDRLIGDSLRIRQVLINLMNNAVKYTEEGHILLSLTLEKEDEKGLFIRFSVKDSGQGIRENDLQQLFEAFSQVDKKKNHKIEGTGLGLTISRDLVHLMGGELSVTSQYGCGSEFFFSIYQKRASEDVKSLDERKRELSTTAFDAKGAKILVVDDTAINIKIAKIMLEEIGAVVEAAGSGSAAVEMARNNTYKIIFMDYMMPYMDGAETTQKIRALSENETNKETSEYYKNVPIIALTGDTDPSSIERFFESGMNDYVEKPIVKEKLKEMLLKWL